MKLPLQIAFHNMPHDAEIESAIWANAEWLETYDDRIMSCRVVVEAPHAHHHKGKLYRLHIDIKVPGRDISVTRDPAEHHSHEDIYVALRDAFDAAKRQLQDHARIERGDVKSLHKREAT